MSSSLSSPSLSSRALRNDGGVPTTSALANAKVNNNNNNNNNHRHGQGQGQGQFVFDLPSREERDRAVKEAEKCLEAITNGEGFQLDGFNLLGVVANPRSGGSGTTSTSTSMSMASLDSASAAENATQQHQQQQQQQQQQPISNATTTITTNRQQQQQQQQQQRINIQYGSVSSDDQHQHQPSQQHGIFSDAVQTFEYTLAQVAEQIESLNVYLEQLSKQYLGDDTDESLFLEYYYQNEEDDENSPEHMMRADNIPPELVDLQLHDLQYYLEECGVLAHTLVAQGLNTRTLNDEDVIDEEKLRRQLEEIPSVFYDTQFDLTDARTFAELLLRQDDDEEEDDVDDNNNNKKKKKNGEASENGSSRAAPNTTKDTKTTKTTTKTNDNNNNTKKTIEAKNSLYQPTHELVPVREQDFLAGHLDRVELALQEQVRQKSTAFFHETTRFRQLQSSIVDLLQQVQNLRVCMQQALGVYKQTRDISDHQRQDYEMLVDLLDGSMELVRCKASIGGLLSANDHLGAALQIQYGRRLLNGGSGSGDGSGSGHDDSNAVGNENGSDAVVANGHNDHHGDATTARLEIRLLTALSACGDQFDQYESLVVQSLSEELVEIFFNWRSSERERVRETVEALQICHALRKTSELYQRRLQQMIRMTVRTTIAEFMESSSSSSSSSSPNKSKKTSGGVTGMTYPAFYNCLQLLIEEIQSILTMAHRVDEFCASEAIFGEESSSSSSSSDENNPQTQQQQRWTKDAVAQGAELATKSIAELLRLRKEAHSVITLSEMKQLWDTCIEFTTKMESYGNQTRAVSLRSTLVGQAKAFLDRTHEANMSALVAALDSERWSQCEVSIERQLALTRLCTGLATSSTALRNVQQNGGDDQQGKEKKPVAIVEGVNYKVVWSCLLLVEMIMTNLSSAAYFQQTLATNAVTKVVELMRLFNARTTNLVLGAGAIHSAARLKSINAKHLSYVTQCLEMTLSLLPHIRAALMSQLPTKQHALLADLDSIRNEYNDHNEKVLNKFVSIIGGIVEHGLAPRIGGVNFDERGQSQNQPTPNDQQQDAVVECFVFLDGIATSTRKLHTVLNQLLPPDHLQDVFSRIFAHLDQQIPALFVAAASNGTFSFPSTDSGKHRLLSEVAQTTSTLNSLKGVLPWDFTAINVLERKLDYMLPEPKDSSENSVEEQAESSAEGENEETAETTTEEPGAQNGTVNGIPTEGADQINNDAEVNAETDTDVDAVNEAKAPDLVEEEDTTPLKTENTRDSQPESSEAKPSDLGEENNTPPSEANTPDLVETHDDPPPEAEATQDGATESNGELPMLNGSVNAESTATDTDADADAQTNALLNGECHPSQENGTETIDNRAAEGEE